MRNMLLACVCALPLIACQSGGPPVTEASIVANIDLEAKGLNAALASPAVLALLPAGDLPKVKDALSSLMAVDAAVLADPNSLFQKGNVAIVEGDINTILNALAANPLIPKPYSDYVAAAAILAPVIEAEINAFVPPVPAPVVGPVAGSAPISAGPAVAK